MLLLLPSPSGEGPKGLVHRPLWQHSAILRKQIVQSLSTVGSHMASHMSMLFHVLKNNEYELILPICVLCS